MPCEKLFLAELPLTYGRGGHFTYGDTVLTLPTGCFVCICRANRLLATDCPKDRLKYQITPHCWRFRGEKKEENEKP